MAKTFRPPRAENIAVDTADADMENLQVKIRDVLAGVVKGEWDRLVQVTKPMKLIDSKDTVSGSDSVMPGALTTILRAELARTQPENLVPESGKTQLKTMAIGEVLEGAPHLHSLRHEDEIGRTEVMVLSPHVEARLETLRRPSESAPFEVALYLGRIVNQ